MSSAFFNGVARSRAAASADAAVIAQDLSGTITSWNRAAEQIFGHSAAEAVGQSIRLIVPPELEREQDEMPRRIEAGGSLDPYYTVRLRKDGVRVDVSLTVSPPAMSGGDVVVGYLPAGIDGRRQERADAALLKAGALQRAILDSASFSSIATDANGVIQIFNVGAERMLGYAAADVVNRITPADISDPQEVIARARSLSAELSTPITPGFEALVFKASRGIEDIYELTYIRKDGSRFPAVVSVTALRDAHDTIIGYLLIGTDNTTRKPAEQALRLAAIVDSTDDGIISKDLDGTITSWNRAAERMFGFSASEIVGRSIRCLIPDHLQGEEDHVQARIRRGERVEHYETVRRRKDGVVIPVSLSVSPIRNVEGTVIGASKIGRDISERKRAAAGRRRLQPSIAGLVSKNAGGSHALVQELQRRLPLAASMAKAADGA
jgi:PAS domain S-box-containing protein